MRNERAVLTTNDGGIYTASITEMPCRRGAEYAGDCEGPKVNHLWEVVWTIITPSDRKYQWKLCQPERLFVQMAK